MNTKVIISLILFVTTHNNFCMIIDTKKKKQVCTIYKQQEISAENFLKQFMLCSIKKNSENFYDQTYAVKKRIINQYEKNNSHNKDIAIIQLIQLSYEHQHYIISQLFQGKSEEVKNATEYYLSIPLEQALKKYNDLPLYANILLPQPIVFILTKKQLCIVKEIYEKQAILSGELTYLQEKLPINILETINQKIAEVNIIVPYKELLPILVNTPKRTYNENSLSKVILAYSGSLTLLSSFFCISSYTLGIKSEENFALAILNCGIPFCTAQLCFLRIMYDNFCSETSIKKPLISQDIITKK